MAPAQLTHIIYEVESDCNKDATRFKRYLTEKGFCKTKVSGEGYTEMEKWSKTRLGGKFMHHDDYNLVLMANDLLGKDMMPSFLENVIGFYLGHYGNPDSPIFLPEKLAIVAI